MAYLCGEFPRATDTFIQREVAALRAAGCEVQTISVRRPPPAERGTDEQQEHRRRTRYLLPCSPWRLAADHFAMLVASPARYLSSLWLALTVRAPGIRALLYQLFYFAEAGMAAAHMKRQKLTHLHNHAPDSSGYVTMIAAAMGGFTYSLTLHGFGILSEPSRWRLTEKIQRSLFCIGVSWHARSQAMLWSDPSVWDRLHVVHCGVEPTQHPPRVHTGVGRSLLFVGRLDHVKGLPVLLESIHRLRQRHVAIHLDIVGDGPERARVEAMVHDLDLGQAVTLHGYLSQEQLQPLFDACDVMVMASFAEGVPVVLMEAMSRGLPVVAPRITGIPELVEHGESGLLFTPGRADELAEAVAELLEQPERRTQLAERAMQVVLEQFNLQREVARFVNVVHNRLAGQPVEVRPDVEHPPAAKSPTRRELIS